MENFEFILWSSSLEDKEVSWKKKNIKQKFIIMREIVHLQAGQCGNQIGAKVSRLCTLIHLNKNEADEKLVDVAAFFRYILLLMAFLRLHPRLCWEINRASPLISFVFHSRPGLHTFVSASLNFTKVSLDSSLQRKLIAVLFPPIFYSLQIHDIFFASQVWRKTFF